MLAMNTATRPRAVTTTCKTASRTDKRVKRHQRMRNKIAGTTERPRLAVFKSNEHTYAQIIDDTQGVTLAAASTLSKGLRETLSTDNVNAKTVSAAEMVGKLVAEAGKAAGVEKVVFDRGGFLYHGRIRAVAEGAREGGLDF
ncbi:ribosomal protein L18 [Pseudoscourfieldia marina]